jgi:hypothetical protein
MNGITSRLPIAMSAEERHMKLNGGLISSGQIEKLPESQ